MPEKDPNGQELQVELLLAPTVSDDVPAGQYMHVYMLDAPILEL